MYAHICTCASMYVWMCGNIPILWKYVGKDLYIEICWEGPYTLNLCCQATVHWKYVASALYMARYLYIWWQSSNALEICWHILDYVGNPQYIGNTLPMILYIGNMLARSLYSGNTLTYIALHSKLLYIGNKLAGSYMLHMCWMAFVHWKYVGKGCIQCKYGGIDLTKLTQYGVSESLSVIKSHLLCSQQ